MGQSCPTILRVGCQRGQIGRDGRTDVLAHHQCDTLIDRQHAGRAQNHRDSHDGSRTLYTHREHATDEQEYDGSNETIGVERSEEVEHRLIVGQVHVDSGLSQRAQA